MSKDPLTSNKLIFDDIAKEILHRHFVRMKPIVLHEFLKDMGLFED